MSKWIQIDIRLQAAYGEGGLAGCFPNLAKLLKRYDHTRVLEQEPSPYHLVDTLVRLRNDPHVAASDKRALVQRIEELQRVREQAREQLLGRHLNELDETLYQLEDLFRDLDRELTW